MSLFGPRFPLKNGEQDAFELYDNMKDQISFYLKCLLLTSPGEKISDPGYGVGLRTFLFEPGIPETSGRIQSLVSAQISKYLPFIGVESVSVLSSDESLDENRLNLQIVYYIPNQVEKQIFDLQVNSSDEATFY